MTTTATINNKTITVSARIKSSLKRKVDVHCAHNGLKIQSFLEAALEYALLHDEHIKIDERFKT